MIHITIELWPRGDSSRKRQLAQGKIWNTGEGTLKRGKYRFSFWKKTERSAKEGEITEQPCDDHRPDGPDPVNDCKCHEIDRLLNDTVQGGVEGFPRLSYSVWELLRRCLNSTDVR